MNKRDVINDQMMFRVFQVDDSTIVDCFTGVARSDVILSFFSHDPGTRPQNRN